MENTSHVFAETKSRSTCDFCGDDWPAAELVVKFFECESCHFSVHKGCQAMASMCAPCNKPDQRKMHRRSSSSSWGVLVQTERRRASRPVSGRVVVRIIRAHDMIGIENNQLYCTARLNSGNAEIRSNVSPLIQGGTWDVSTDMGCGGAGGTFSVGDTVSIPNSLPLDPGMFSKGSTIPVIDFSLWRSTWLAAFDTTFASCSISLFPLLSHPGVTAERWFSVRSPEGAAAGKVFMNIVFLPSNQGQEGQSRSRTSSQESIDLDEITAAGSGSVDGAAVGATNESVLFAPIDSGGQTQAIPALTNKLGLRIRTGSEDQAQAPSSPPPTSISSPTHTNAAGVSPQAPVSPPAHTAPLTVPEDQTSQARSWVAWGDSLVGQWTGVSITQKATEMANDVMKMSGLDVGQTSASKALDGPAVGKLRVHLHSATRTGKQADKPSGNYCAGVSVKHAASDEKTHVVWQNMYQNCNPKFDKYYEFDVPHFQSGITLSLMDHTKGTVVGTSHVSISSLLIRDADKFDSQWEVAEYEDVSIRSETDPEEVIGTFRVRIRFQEDVYGLFTSAMPHDAQICPDEDLSLDRLRTHIARFRAYIGWFYVLYEEYCGIMDWRDPVLSGVLFVLFIYASLFVDAEYGFCAPLFVLVLLQTRAYYKRKSGAFKQRWVEKGRPDEEPFRPLAYLRVAVREFRGLNQVQHDMLSNMVRGAGSDRSPRHEKTPRKPAGQGEDDSLYGGGTSGSGKYPYVKINYCPMELDMQETPTPVAGGGDGGGGGAPLSSSGEEVDDEEARDSSDELHPNEDGPQILGGLFSTPAKKERPKKDELGTLDRSADRAPNTNAVDAAASDNNEGNKQKELLVACLPPMSSGYDQVDAVHPNQQQSVHLSQLMNTLSLLRSRKANDAFLYNFHYPWPQNVTEDEDMQTPFRTSEAGTLCDEAEDGLIYPIQQPLKIDPAGVAPPELLPWTKNKGVLRLLMYGEDPFASFMDSHWGSVVVPVSSLLSEDGRGDIKGGAQNEVDAWFDVECRKGSLKDPSSSRGEDSGDSEDGHSPRSPSDDCPGRVQVRLRLQVVLRDPRKEPTDSEIRKSAALRAILTAGAGDEEGMLSGLLGMRKNIQYVQNLMAYILNFLESFKNVLNWTVPSKTYPLYIGLILTWIATIIIPGRYLVLGIGLYEFLYCFFPQPDEFPIVTRFFNLLEAVPNDDELEQVFADENAAYLSALEEDKRNLMSWGRLNLIHACHWSGCVQIKGLTVLGGGTTWDEAYLVIQGRRLVWWTREVDMSVSAPIGHILLYGHAGTTQPSPVDIREMGGDDSRILAIFGMDVNGKPNRRTVICKDATDKTVLIREMARVLGLEDDLEEPASEVEAAAVAVGAAGAMSSPLPLADKKRQ